MRGYGPENFKVVQLLEFDDLAKAVAAEISAIQMMSTTDRRWGYNVSAGGEYDAPTGAHTFWSNIRKDPDAYSQYIQNLSDGCKKKPKIAPLHLIELNKNLPAKERWKRAYRASRIAAKSVYSHQTGRKLSADHVDKIRLALKKVWAEKPPSKKKRHSMTNRKSAIAQWARTDPDKKASIFSKISETLKTRHASEPDYHAAVAEQLGVARKSIDRAKQGTAASKGLKQYWVDLKNDPERYDAYIKSRAASLKATNARKAAKCE